jgi:hypothetical protein
MDPSEEPRKVPSTDPQPRSVRRLSEAALAAQSRVHGEVKEQGGTREGSQNDAVLNVSVCMYVCMYVCVRMT